MRTCTTSLLSVLPLVAAAAAGAHVAMPATALDASPPRARSLPPDAIPPDAALLRADAHTPAATPSGAPPGPALECVYDNYFPLDDFGAPASQKDVVYPFFAEAADDFVLFGSPDNLCDVDEVRFAVTYFNVPAGVIPDPLACWTGVKITIYEDITAGPGDPSDPNCLITKGPAGYPDDTVLPERDHTECFPGAVVCELKIPMSQVLVSPLSTPCVGQGNAFDIQVVGLAGQCLLAKNRKYWIAIAPEQEFALCGQTAILLSQFNIEHPAMQYFSLLGIVPWTPVTGNADGCPPSTPPAGSSRDLAIQIIALKDQPGQPPYCPWDCGVQDKQVNIQDLLALLGQWGGPGSCDFDGNGIVNIVDLLALLSAWGPCPTPVNDECEDKISITVVPDQPVNLPVDMRGATPGDSSDPNFCPPLCVPPQKDVWYCIVYGGSMPADVTVSTTFDVFIEVYAGCDCIWPPILIDCRPGLQGAQFKMFPNDAVCVRLINYQNLPNEELKGRMDISAVPQIRLGACCFTDGTCADGLLEDECLAGGGTWYSNQFCADIICEPLRFGACCVPGTACIDGILEIECLDAGGFWFGNRSCEDVSFCDPSAPRDCPPGSNYGQRPHQPTENWIFGTSDIRPGLKRYDDFPHDGRLITSLWFWGADLRFNGTDFEECNDPAPRFNVAFYPDDGTGHPVKTQPVCEFFGLPAVEKNLKGFYTIGTLTLAGWQYKVFLDCPLPPGEWWVSIQGAGGQAPNCWFLWLSSPNGNGVSVFEDQNTGDQTDELYDLSFCINRPSGTPSYDCEFCPFPPVEGGEECVDPELNCLYQIVAVTGVCADPSCQVGNFLCASPCPPTQSEQCPGPLVNFLVGGPTGGCTVTALLINPQCDVCPPGSCRLLVVDPNW